MQHTQGSEAVPFQLKDVRVDPAIGIISGPCGVLHLEPRVMAVLLALARRPDKLVSRAELLAEIWPGGEIYDEALTQCVYKLRQQLVSAGGNPSYRDLINTVPKRGYFLKGNSALFGTPTEPLENPGFPRSSAYPSWLVALFLILAIAWFAYSW